MDGAKHACILCIFWTQLGKFPAKVISVGCKCAIYIGWIGSLRVRDPMLAGRIRLFPCLKITWFAFVCAAHIFRV